MVSTERLSVQLIGMFSEVSGMWSDIVARRNSVRLAWNVFEGLKLVENTLTSQNSKAPVKVALEKPRINVVQRRKQKSSIYKTSSTQMSRGSMYRCRRRDDVVLFVCMISVGSAPMAFRRPSS